MISAPTWWSWARRRSCHFFFFFGTALVIFVLWVDGVPAKLIWGGEVIVLMVGAFSLAQRATSDSEQFGEAVREGVLDIFLAICFSLIIVGGAHPGDWKAFTSALSDNVESTAMIAILIMAVNVVGAANRTIGHLRAGIIEPTERLEDAVSDAEGLRETLKKSVEEANHTFSGAEYAALAAQLLNLDAGALEDDGVPRGLPRSMFPAVRSARNWIARGTDMKNVTARRGWWRIMEIYHQEEIYDVAQYEVATNVRNYAFILISLLEQYLSDCPDNKRVVVAQCTAFSPKDFYNFPGGRAGGRYYHEPEFFGIYRRLLSMLVQHDKADVRRVFLSKRGTESNAELGWPVDSIATLAQQCGRYRIIPTPVVVGGNSNAASEADPAQDLKNLCARFPKEHDPANSLPSSSRTYLWVPTYVCLHGRFKKDLPAGKHWQTAYKYQRVGMGNGPPVFYDLDPSSGALRETKWAESFRDSIENNQTTLDHVSQHFEGLFPQDFWTGANSSGLKSPLDRMGMAWRRLISEVLAVVGTTEIEPVGAWITSPIGNNTYPEEQIRTLTAQRPPVVAAGLQRLLKHVRTIEDRASQLVALQHGGTLGSSAVTHMTMLVEAIHDVDAILKELPLQAAGGTGMRENLSGARIGSSGLPLGAGEHWLHRFLIYLEAVRWSEWYGNRKAPIPLWRLVAADLLNIQPVKDTRTSFDDVRQEMLRKLRLVAVDPKCEDYFKNPTAEPNEAPTNDETVAQWMRRNGILPEFLLIGIKDAGEPGDEGLADTEWQVLVGPQINEPFHTCRVFVRFSGYQDPDDLLDRHAAFVESTWISQGATADANTFLNELRDVIRTADPMADGTTQAMPAPVL